MTSPIRVLLMIDDASVGGGQQHILALAERLDRQTFEVSVACEGKGYLVDELQKRAIPVYPLTMSNRPAPRPLIQCIRLIHRLRPTIVHTHGGTAGFHGRIASFFAPSIRLVHTYHGIHYLHDRQGIQSWIYRLVDRLLKKWTDRLVCVSQSDYTLGVQHNVLDPQKTEVIRNGIDVDRFVRTAKASSDKAGYPRVVGTIGRLHMEKGHSYLVKAAAQVLKVCPSILFEITGEGELRGDLENEIRSLGLEDHVKLLGERTDVESLFERMDVFVLPSFWEGLPLVLLEAMAAGVPIVATAVGGILEVVTHDREALLVPPRHEQQLAQEILRVLSDRELAARLTRNALQKVRNQFSVDKMVKATENMYKTTVNM